MNRRVIGLPLMRLLGPFRKLATTSIGFGQPTSSFYRGAIPTTVSAVSFFSAGRFSISLSLSCAGYYPLGTQDSTSHLTWVSWKDLPALRKWCLHVSLQHPTPSQFAWNHSKSATVARRTASESAKPSWRATAGISLLARFDHFRNGRFFHDRGACLQPPPTDGRQSRPLLQTIAVARLNFVTTGSTPCPM